MSDQLSIPCPDCKTPIPFDPRMLIQGAQFSCPKCKAFLGLASESKEIVRESLDKFDKMKSEVLKAKGDTTGF
ncbi:MAG TPA: hypothetical protein VFU15_05810 [Bacteroidia bacterium]|nr:hypothetical protein [Bacteroidia bacterium]